MDSQISHVCDTNNSIIRLLSTIILLVRGLVKWDIKWSLSNQRKQIVCNPTSYLNANTILTCLLIYRFKEERLGWRSFFVSSIYLYLCFISEVMCFSNIKDAFLTAKKSKPFQSTSKQVFSTEVLTFLQTKNNTICVYMFIILEISVSNETVFVLFL